MFSGLADCRSGETVQVDGPEGYHAATVKRCRVGDTIALLSGVGDRAIGRIESIDGHKSSPVVSVTLGDVTSERRSSSVEIWSALPKGDRLESMLDQLSQLGVARWRALLCDRSERKWSSIKPTKLERVLIESAKQCDRAWVMEIAEPISFVDAIDAPGASAADADGAAAAELTLTSTPIVLIGPEGGWSDAERERMEERSLPIVRLGAHVLRLETAACCAAAVVGNLDTGGR